MFLEETVVKGVSLHVCNCSWMLHNHEWRERRGKSVLDLSSKYFPFFIHPRIVHCCLSLVKNATGNMYKPRPVSENFLSWDCMLLFEHVGLGV